MLIDAQLPVGIDAPHMQIIPSVDQVGGPLIVLDASLDHYPTTDLMDERLEPAERTDDLHRCVELGRVVVLDLRLADEASAVGHVALRLASSNQQDSVVGKRRDDRVEILHVKFLSYQTLTASMPALSAASAILPSDGQAWWLDVAGGLQG